MRSVFWLWSPLIPVAGALLVLSLMSSSGLDGAARSLAAVCWFLPTVAVLVLAVISHWQHVPYSRLKKWTIVLIWILPSLPLGLMSWMGLMLVSEVGFAILR